MTPPRLRSADRYYAQSAAIARQAVRAASKRGKETGAISAVALIIAQYQAAQATQVAPAATAMLAEQGITSAPEAPLDPMAFAAPVASIEAMLTSIQADIEAEIQRETARIEAEAAQMWADWRFGRLVTSLTQDAARMAQQVDIVTRPRIAHVRHLVLPSCSRCAVLAGRVYRWSDGFQRHPGCDCVMIPTTIASDQMAYDIDELVRTGQVTGLSKADRRAIADGADFNQVVNARRGGLRAVDFKRYRQSGRMRLTPQAIYDAATDREHALRLLKLHGYIR